MAAAGSSDRWHTGENPYLTMIFFFTRNVHVWDVDSQKLVYKLPGHLGSVNDVDFHSVEPIILSVGSDKNIYLGEFEP